MGVLTFGTYSAARSHLKDVFDAAESGRTAVLRRDNVDSVVVNGTQLRQFLALATSGRVQVVPESDGWSLMLPGTAIAAHADSLDGAVIELIEALREYADDWLDRLLDVPNHRGNWGLVQLIVLSDDDQLKAWITGTSG